MTRLHREIMAGLVSSIVSGERPPGSMLPREIDLAEQFDVSRGTARETLRALEERGLVSVRHGRGATVAPRESWDVLAPDVLVQMLAGVEGEAVLSDYLECRRILEVEAAGMAADRAGDEHLTRMRDALARMEATTSAQPTAATETAFHEADLDFHQAMFQAAGNHALSALVHRIHSALFVARLSTARPEYRVSRAIPEHQAILRAVADRDPEAARAAMRTHLATVAQYLGEKASVD